MWIVSPCLLPLAFAFAFAFAIRISITIVHHGALRGCGLGLLCVCARAGERRGILGFESAMCDMDMGGRAEGEAREVRKENASVERKGKPQ